MDTMRIQVTNDKAVKLLHELEDLHLVKVLKHTHETTTHRSEKYAGKLPSNITAARHHYVAQSREEWGK